MKKATKVLSLVLACVVAFAFVLTACGQSAGTEKETTAVGQSTGAAETTTEEKKLEPVTLTWYFPGSTQKDEEAVEGAISEYLKDKINVTLDFNPIDWGTWFDKKNVMIASGEEFDIMFTATWSGYTENVAKGAFVDITDMIDQYLPKTKEALNPAFFNGSKVGGRNYAVPTNKEVAIAQGLVYRKDIADKLGLDMNAVKTLDDLDAVFKAVKEKEAGMTPLYVDRGMTAPDSMIRAIGDTSLPGIYDESQKKVINEYESYVPQLKFLEKKHQWYKAGYISKDASTSKLSDGEAAKSGKFFSLFNGYHPGKPYEMKLANGTDWEVVPFTVPSSDTATVTGSMQAVSRTSKNPERALMFLEYMNSDKYVNNTVNYGIEGTHYKKVKDNVIDFADGLKADTSPYNPASAWMFGNQFLNYTWTFEPENKWELYKAWNDSSVPAPILGFSFNNDPVKSEAAACTNVFKEYERGLGTGTYDPAVELPKFIAKLKANGMDKVIAEKQKQIDEWMASQAK